MIRLAGLRSWAVVAVVLLAAASAAADDPAPSAPATDDEPAVVSPPEIVLSTQKPPEFPPAALAARLSARVLVEALVLPDGKVGKVTVVECTHPRVGFEEATVRAVEKWEFLPALGPDGQAVEAKLRFRLSFTGDGPAARRAPTVSAGGFTYSERSADAVRIDSGTGR